MWISALRGSGFCLSGPAHLLYSGPLEVFMVLSVCLGCSFHHRLHQALLLASQVTGNCQVSWTGFLALPPWSHSPSITQITDHRQDPCCSCLGQHLTFIPLALTSRTLVSTVLQGTPETPPNDILLTSPVHTLQVHWTTLFLSLWLGSVQKVDPLLLTA